MNPDNARKYADTSIQDPKISLGFLKGLTDTVISTACKHFIQPIKGILTVQADLVAAETLAFP